MTVKDEIVTWFLRNIIIPKNEIIDSPGFIVLKLSMEKEVTNLREIFLPEFLISKLETCLVDKYGKKGKQLLYSIGKKFGYMYSKNSNYPTLETSTKKEFLNFTYIVVRYLEAIYAKKIKEEIDVENKIFKIKTGGYIICNENGLGYILTDGSIAGVWTYGTGDPTIEGVQVKCQGRGDKECEIICAPENYFKNKKIDFFKERDYSDLEICRKDYNEINKIRPTKFATNSFLKLLDSDFFEQKHGVITGKDGRYILLEASFLYILEKELKKVKDGLKILWGVSFDFGKKLAKISKADDPCKFIMEFFPALGFGDIMATKSGEKYEIYVNYFPWLKWADEINFTMFRGILSGVISGSVNKKVELKKIEKDISMGHLSLHISN
ncbi:MAG: hypothetical protein KAT37_01120 [Candidatus Aenigmarchaeota archaeon]|nr:hypothetical protein [Candidatus Aenigmarchaeota archaeon]